MNTKLVGGHFLFLLFAAHAIVYGQRPELVLQAGHGSGITDLEFSPDERWLASAGDGAILWELATGRVWRSLSGHQGSVTGIAFNPDGSRIVTAGEDGTAMMWDVESGRAIRTLDGRGTSLHDVALSRDGRHVATVGSDGLVQVWDEGSGELLWSPRGHEGTVRSVSFHPNHRWLLTSGDDKTARIWDLRRQATVHVLSGHESWVYDAAFSRDGSMVATASYDESVKLWDTESGAEIRTLPHRLDVTTVEFSPTGELLVSTAYNEDVTIWDVASGRELRKLTGRPGAVAFSPNGATLATKSSFLGREVQLIDAHTWREHRVLGGQASPPYDFALSADGGWMATAAGTAVHLWDRSGGHVAESLVGRGGAVIDVAISADASRLASLDNRGSVQIWDRASGRPLHTIGHRGNGETRALALSPDGRVAATGFEAEGERGRPASNSLDHTVMLWDAGSGSELFTLVGHTDPVHAVAFSPDGTMLASGSGHYGGPADNSVRLWDVRAGREIRSLSGHRQKVNVLAFSPNGRLLASGSGNVSRLTDPADRDNTVRLWDTGTGSELHALNGHEEEIMALAFRPDGGQVASGSSDNTIIAWDVATGREAQSFIGHTGGITKIAYTQDGRHLLSASQDGSMRLWDASSGQMLAVLISQGASRDWVVVNPEGLFDGSPNGRQTLIAWRIGRQTHPPDRYVVDFYTPGLLTQLLDGERPGADVDLASLKLPPDVRIVSPIAGAAPDDPNIEVAVEVGSHGSDIEEVRLYQQGKLVGSSHGKPGESQRYTFEVTLVEGDNELRATAINVDQVEGNDDWIRVSARNIGKPTDTQPEAEVGAAELHVLAVGINQYEDSAFNLSYARIDAEAVARFFEQPNDLYRDVHIEQLTDQAATKENIQDALDRLIETVRREDVVILYLAGHGVVLGEQYYFLPHEMRSDTPDPDDAVRKYGMPASVVGDAMFRISALKQVLIVDACQSEGVLDVLSKSVARSQKKALEMLARSRGVHMIAASTKEQFAFEIADLQHGVLTYALLRGLGESGRPAAPVMDGIVTVASLLQYVNREVPDLTEELSGDNKQYPMFSSTGMDFPLWFSGQ